MTQFKVFTTIFLVFVVLDVLWFGLLMGGVYKQYFAFAKPQFTKLSGIITFISVYALMSIGILLFVLPQLTGDATFKDAFVWGALFGLIVYGVYEGTNYAFLPDWPAQLIVIDTLWGAFVCAVASGAGWWVLRSF